MKTFVKASIQANLFPTNLRLKYFLSKKAPVKASGKTSVKTFAEKKLLQIESLGGRKFSSVKASVKLL